MSDISIYSTNDGLKAYLFVPEAYKGFYPDTDILLKYLNDKGVVYGINMGTIEQMVSEGVCNKRILVAEGLPAEPGVDGHLEILVDTSGIGKPKKLADGRVDHKDLKKVINVKKNDKLIRRVPPQPGKDGYTIFGTKIMAPSPNDAFFKVGAGTEISEENPDILIAAHDGAVKLNHKGEIEVRTAKVVTGDIDYSTGNISFSGDLKVQGTVRAGFAVEAHGNLLIGGSVEDAEVTCTGNMEIIGGAVGSGSGKLDCGGTLKVHHIENFNVTAGGHIIVSDTILHSAIKTEEYLNAKTLVGGKIEAAQGITVDTIGASSETKSVITVGSAYLLMQEKKLFLEKVAELAAKLNTCKDDMYNCVKNGMDDTGYLSDEDTAELDILKERRSKIIRQLTELENKIKEIDDALEEMPNPVITAKKIFPVTIIRFGLVEKIVKENLHNVIISADGNKINVQKQ